MTMKRHIGLWEDERNEQKAVSELVIEGNHIEFYRRGNYSPFHQTFICSDSDHKYKVFTHGMCDYGKHRTLDSVCSHKVLYVLQQNCDFQQGFDINGINSASFIIPELIGWLGFRTVEQIYTADCKLAVVENKKSEIVLKESNPKIEILFETRNAIFDTGFDDRTTGVITNQPRIQITYDQAGDIHKLCNDINSVMQFFSLMIGYVSNVCDIRLDIEGQSLKSWLYVNRDFSYNMRAIWATEKMRTAYNNFQDLLNLYFENWYDFCNDDIYEFIRRMYFESNRNKDYFAEDIIVQYTKILEGYHLRVTGDETKANEFRDALKSVEKEIKSLIFNDKGKSLFTAVLNESVPDWKYNSSHAGDISAWIAKGFLSRTGLAQRLERLDSDYYCVIAKNSKYIQGLSREQDDEFNIYRRIVDTRNYYSHYKADINGVLNYNQICSAINTLKALILMILYTKMGMAANDARRIVSEDSELQIQTACLRETEDVE